MLTDAWDLYAKYDFNAQRQQRNYRRYQSTLLLLGLLATLLAILQTVWEKNTPVSKEASIWGSPLTLALVVTTATGSGLLTALNRYKPGEKWLALRAGAQAVEREIYCYRAQAGSYRGQPGQTRLYQKLNAISTGLSDIVLEEPEDVAISRPQGSEPPDTESFPLVPDHYVASRLAGQLAYYRSRLRNLNRQVQVLHGVSILAGTFGTILALVHQAIWVPLTTALTTACLSYLQQRQLEVTLAQYNQSYNSLARVDSWWRNELSEAERALPENIDKLVMSTEDILEVERTTWTQKLSDAMAKMEVGTGGEGKPPLIEPKLVEPKTALVDSKLTPVESKPAPVDQKPASVR